MQSENVKYVKGLVSIVMPVYNGDKFMNFSIDSVVEQSYEKWELWIINDASNDASLHIANEYADNDARIKVIDLPINSGVATARNKGLERARGEFIAFIDADDIWKKNKLKEQIDFARSSEGDVVYTGYNVINSCGKTVKRRFVPETVSFNDLLLENVVIFSTLFLKHIVLGGTKFNKRYFHEDYVFSLELLKKGYKFYGINKSLVEYRVYGGGKSYNKVNAAKERWKIYREYLHLGVFESLFFFANYAVHGVLKYI